METVNLDHAFILSKNVAKAGSQLPDLLGVPFKKLGGAYAVYINDGFTLEFVNAERDIYQHHFCFRVSEENFSDILARIQAAEIVYGSESGSSDMEVNSNYGGRIVYWTEPDGHQWEILTVSYARQKS